MQQYNEYFIYLNRWKNEVHDNFFKWIVNFVTSYILILMIKDQNWDFTGFPQMFVSVWMLYSAIQSAFWAIMIVAWQYAENKLVSLYQRVYGKE